jgi:hypothetical protein
MYQRGLNLPLSSETMTMRIAACACGQLTVTCQGEPLIVSLCHCLACQRRTGSIFGVAGLFPRDRVTVAGTMRDFTRPSDSGFDVTHHFCPDCGSTVWWEPKRRPDLVAVASGAFADPHFPAPTQSVNEGHRHSWIGFEIPAKP